MKKPREPRQPREKYKVRTRLIHGSFPTERWDYDHHVVPPQSSSATFRLTSADRGARGFKEFGSATAQDAPIYVYDRLDEPTRGMLEENLAAAEGGEMAVTYSTGMAAITGTFGALLKQGDHVVAHRALYGSTYTVLATWLPRWGITATFVDMTDPAAIVAAARPKTRIIYFETPVNPTMELIDLAAVAEAARQINAGRDEKDRAVTMVDNTFATPFCQRPIEFGIDLVVHSLTKDICGFGTDMGGAVIGGNRFYHPLMGFRKDFGGVLSPRNAWPILVYGLPSLPARMVAKQKAAMKVAEFLLRHPKVSRVAYPGLSNFPQSDMARRQMISYDGKFAPGGLLYFELKGTAATVEERVAASNRFVDFIAEHAYTITLAVSLGQVKTLIENPFSMTHAGIPASEKATGGVSPDGIRLSLGLEDWHDIIADLEAALAVV
jgi:methionine-gamma-lyase